MRRLALEIRGFTHIRVLSDVVGRYRRGRRGLDENGPDCGGAQGGQDHSAGQEVSGKVYRVTPQLCPRAVWETDGQAAHRACREPAH